MGKKCILWCKKYGNLSDSITKTNNSVSSPTLCDYNVLFDAVFITVCHIPISTQQNYTVNKVRIQNCEGSARTNSVFHRPALQNVSDRKMTVRILDLRNRSWRHNMTGFLDYQIIFGQHVKEKHIRNMQLSTF